MLFQNAKTAELRSLQSCIDACHNQPAHDALNTEKIKDFIIKYDANYGLIKIKRSQDEDCRMVYNWERLKADNSQRANFVSVLHCNS